jgi:large repetitive protein
MAFILNRRAGRATLGLVVLVASVLVTTTPVRADTPNNPVTTTVQVNGAGTKFSPGATITGLHDGDTLNIHVDAQSPPNTVASSIFGVTARQCKSGVDIENLIDYTPSQEGNCSNVALGAGDLSTTIATAPPNATADLAFKVGIGTTTFDTVDNGTVTITCDGSTPCQVVLREQAPGGDFFVHYNIQFAAAAHKPGPPTAAHATAGNGQATVSWVAPADNGGAAITGYTATSSPGGLTCTTATTSCAVTGLTNFTAYTFTVTATNAAHLTSDPSAASNSVTPLPTAPTGVSGIPGDSQVTVSWTASSPAPTNYTVAGSPGGACGPTSSTSCVVSGLTNGTPYTFIVTAHYAGGTTVSTASAPITPNGPTKPGPPTAVTATGGNGQASVSWTAPADAGHSVITSYLVTSAPGGMTCTTATTTCTVTGLTNFTSYTFTVTATNAGSLTSDPSAPSNSVVPLPSKPVITTVTPSNAQVTISWNASSPAPTNYTVNGAPSGTCTTASTSCVITGLTNGTSYTFTVTANYPGGTTVSNASSPVIPAGPPGPPTGVSATAGNGQATASWTAPVDNGGAALTGYTATASPGGAHCTTSGATTCTITGLTNFTAYTVTVTATNASPQTSAPSSPSSPVTPLPSKPVITTVTPGNAQVTISWNASSPAPTDYTVNGTPSGTCTTASTSCVITGLTNGTSYTFTVTANYPGGTTVSNASSPVTPLAPTPPGAPTNVKATPGNGQAVVTWTAPGNAGTQSLAHTDAAATITGYTVTAAPGGATCTSTGATTCTVHGLSNFTAYTFTVTATNSAGLTGAASSPSTAVTPVPVKPVITKVTPGDGEVTVTWSAANPAPDGYAVAGTPGGSCTTTTATTCTIGALTNGTSYTFVVTATYGDNSVSSVASVSVAPAVPTTTTTTQPTSSTSTTAATQPTTATTSGSGTLPVTGSNDGLLVELAGLCLLIGASLLLVSRRRQRSVSARS